jgi:hypothetical protein
VTAERRAPFVLLCPECRRETEYPRDPGLEVACPDCKAPVGSYCVRPSEHRVTMAPLHRARLRATHEAGFEPACSCREGHRMRIRGSWYECRGGLWSPVAGQPQSEAWQLALPGLA